MPVSTDLEEGFSVILVLVLIVLFLLGIFTAGYLLLVRPNIDLPVNSTSQDIIVMEELPSEIVLVFPDLDSKIVLGQALEIQLRAIGSEEMLITTNSYADAKVNDNTDLYTFVYEIPFAEKSPIEFIATAKYPDRTLVNYSFSLPISGSEKGALFLISVIPSEIKMKPGETIQLEITGHLNTGPEMLIEIKDLTIQTSKDLVSKSVRTGRALREVVTISEEGLVTAIAFGKESIIISHPDVDSITISVVVVDK